MKMEWTREGLLNPTRLRDSRSKKSKLDGRNPFENDYTRIINSAPFRRMQDKTQVFPLDKSDFIRTRLTHSIEVSSIAQSLGYSIEKQLLDCGELKNEYINNIPSILSCAGLLHDMGNTPFGHFGEKSIQEYYINLKKDSKLLYTLSEDQWNDFTNFDGNAQLFRLITKLQYIQDLYGLNLTSAVLSSVIKYPHSSTEGNKKDKGVAYKKFGYLQSEKNRHNILVDNIKNKIHGETVRNPLVFLLEAADDIAYSMSDLEDGIKKSIITLQEVELVIKNNLGDIKDNKLLNILNQFTKNYSDNYPNDENRKIKQIKIYSQSYMIESVVETFMDNYNDIITGKFDKELLDASKAANLRKSFQVIAEKIFTNEDIVKLELVGHKVIFALLDLFTKTLFSKTGDEYNYKNPFHKKGKIYSLISENYKFIFNKSDQTDYDKFILITDHISGMTDFYALNLYRELNGIIDL